MTSSGSFPLLFALLPLGLGLVACDDGLSSADAASGGTGSGGAASGAGGGSEDGASSGGAGSVACPAEGFVSLTYDDALASQLTNAVPALKARGFRATFFLIDVAGNQTAWSALKNDGHEIASHTLKHPCPAAAWVTPGNASEDYDLTRMATELDDSVAQVQALGQMAPLTFAYPCGVSTVGGENTSYVPLVQSRFAGARGVVGSVIKTLADPYNVPAYFLKTDGASLTAVVDQAVAQQGWVVFGFHGVGGDFEEVTVEAHEALLAHLQTQAVPVLTFAEGLACKKP